MKQIHIVQVLYAGVLLILLISAMPFSIMASESLPTEAQEALAKGLAATRQQDWPLAVRYFTEARKAAPAAPQVIFNLALACDKAGERDLPAIALYRAYLASAPGAANTEQIRSRVLELEVKVESDTIRLLQKAKEMYGVLPQQGLIFPSKSGFYYDVALVDKTLGRFAEAEKSISLIDEPSLRDQISNSLIEARIKAYDLDGALKTMRLHETPYVLALYGTLYIPLLKTGQVERLKEIAERMPDETRKEKAYEDLFNARVATGNLKGALEVLGKIPVDSRPGAYRSLSEKLLQAGDLAGALDTAVKVDEKFRVWRMLEIVKEQAKKGDTAGVAATLEKCIAAAEGMRNEEYLLDSLLRIAEAQIDLGMKDGALGTVRKAMAAAQKPSDSDLSRICGVQAWAGDMEGARKTAESFSDADRTRESPYRLYAHMHMANAQAFAGDKAGARETLSRVESIFPKKPDAIIWYIASAMGATEDEEGLRRVLAEKPLGLTPEFARAMPYVDLFYRRTKLHDKIAARKFIDKALSLASECREPYFACRIYNFVFSNLIESGEKAEAEEIVQRVTALLPQISDPEERGITYGSLSNMKVLFNDLQGAEEAASLIGDEESRDTAYKRIFEAKIKARDTQGAMEIAKRISSLYEKRMACNALADLLVSQGRYKETIAMEGLSKLLLYTKAYSEIDEPQSWSKLADKYFGAPPLADLKGYIEDLKGKDPGDQANDTMKAAQEMAWALEKLRNEAGLWQAYGAIRPDTR
jgi:tetratricopeptide (TPR) repeat protein